MYYDERNFYSVLINNVQFKLSLSIERYPIKLDYNFNEMLLLLREYKSLEEYKEIYTTSTKAHKPFKNSNYIQSEEIFDKTTDMFIWHPRLCTSASENELSPIVNWVRNKTLVQESKHFNPSWCKFVMVKLLGYNYEGKVWFDPNVGWLDRWFTSLSMNIKYIGIDKKNISEYIPDVILQHEQKIKSYDVIFTELEIEDLDIIIEAVEFLKMNHYLALYIKQDNIYEVFKRLHEMKECGYLIVKDKVIWIWMKIPQNIS